jgi:hypothetical protein
MLPCGPQILLPLYGDALYPEGRGSLKDQMAMVIPFRNTNSPNVAHSYVFRGKNALINEIAFSNGHLSSWSPAMESGSSERVEFHNPVASKYLWFPTKIKVIKPQYIFTITLTNVVVSVK